jgi:hypothetical protein
MYYHTGNMSTSLQYHHCQFIYLKLNEPVQSVSIITKVMSSNPVHGEVYLIQHYVKFISGLRQVSVFFPGTPVSSTNKTDHCNIAEILLKVALQHHKPTNCK